MNIDSRAQVLGASAAANAHPEVRAEFIRKTYSHLGGAILAFIGLEYILLTQTNIAQSLAQLVVSSQFGWLGFLGAFILAGWLARGAASNVGSVGAQYFGLALYVVAETIIFAPILFIATAFFEPSVLANAATLTIVLFLGLTLTVFLTRKDFSFLRSILAISGMIAFGLIVCSIIFGFTLGLVFSVVMVVIAAGAILYDTSKVLYHYRTDQHVAASLELFASIALLFWYILRILMSLSRR
ncbi:permease [bacterium E08(2017)]|nr:permease [bacterium E08(2017)]